MASPRSRFVCGVRAMLPALLGVAPLAVLCGVAAVNVGLSPSVALGMSLFIFSGAAQLAAVELIGDGASALLVVATVVLVNLRFLMYSASLAPHLRRVPAARKWLVGYLLSDHAYSVSIARFAREDRETESPGTGESDKLWYFLGAASTLWVAWLVGTAAGAFLGARIPSGWSLDFALPLTFIALAVPAIRDRANAAAALSASLIAVLAVHLPFGLGSVVAATVGIVVGSVVERRLG